MPRARRGDGVGDTAHGRQMVFLDQDRVVQADAVIDAAAAAHRVFLRETQARQRLAGVEDLRVCAGDRIDVTARNRRGSGKRLQEVQRAALAADQGARTALDVAQHRIGRNAIAIGARPFNAHLRIAFAETRSSPRDAHNHRRFPADDARGCASACGDQIGCDIAGTDILRQHAAHVGVDHVLWRRCDDIRHGGQSGNEFGIVAVLRTGMKWSFALRCRRAKHCASSSWFDTSPRTEYWLTSLCLPFRLRLAQPLDDRIQRAIEQRHFLQHQRASVVQFGCKLLRGAVGDLQTAPVHE